MGLMEIGIGSERARRFCVERQWAERAVFLNADFGNAG
jgi:hypothetical protein